MKHYVTTSYKTTLCGLLIGAGQFLVLAPVAQLRGIGSWVNGDNRHIYMVAGVILATLASVALGIVCRDHDVSSEQARHGRRHQSPGV